MTTPQLLNTLPSIKDLQDLTGKRVLVRADLNAPLDDALKVTDDTRIRASLPTVEYLLERGAKVILCSHLGRPKGQVVESMRLKPIVAILQERLPNTIVHYCQTVSGAGAEGMAGQLGNGELMVLENLRFDPREEKNDPAMAEELAKLADIYVNDAFGAAHRAHASTAGIVAFVPQAVAGFLLEKEVAMLSSITNNPQRPVAAIIGGSKISSKIAVLTNLLEKVDVMIIGGGMAYTFFMAQGWGVGNSIVEPDQVDTAKDILAKAQARGVKLVLPVDINVADAFSNDANTQVVPADQIPEGWEGLDAGPATQACVRDALGPCKTILWNGPVGKFEFPNFAQGTRAVADTLQALTQQGAVTVLGGGDTVAAIEGFGFQPEQFTHVSTGGGASLEFLEGRPLPGIEALKK
jgi:phosphoglycerate kinase